MLEKFEEVTTKRTNYKHNVRSSEYIYNIKRKNICIYSLNRVVYLTLKNKATFRQRRPIGGGGGKVGIGRVRNKK